MASLENEVLERIAALSPDKQTLLLQRLKQKVNQPAKNQFSGQVQDATTKLNEWIVPYRQSKQACLRLFCFPYAGGGASLFRTWPDALPAEVDLYGIQLPGREHRREEQAYSRIVPLIQALAEALLPYLERPFAFFGHSMGALVCFELARYLRRMYDKHPVCLYLSARRAPQLPNLPSSINVSRLPKELFKVVLRSDGIAETLLQNEELMQAMLPTLRADFELCETYEYGEEPPLACPFSIFGGMEDCKVGTADLESWFELSSETCALSLLPGSHFFLHSAQDLLLAEISRDLEMRLNALGASRGGHYLV